MFDVIVVGGSYAGMAAALQLARARRTVLVIDAGQRRNRFADASHGFLTRDGEEPGAIAATAKAQLLTYETVTWLDGSAVRAAGAVDKFSVEISDGQRFDARRLILATGVTDILPDLPGLTELWGRHVFHCPYCHGYELNEGDIGVLATGPHSMHQALMLPDWGRTTFFTNDACSPDDEEKKQLAARGVTVETGKVKSVGGSGDKISVHLEDGRELVLNGLFVAPWLQITNPLVEQMGCDVDEGPLGSTVKTDVAKSTSVEGVYAAGDLARPGGSVTFAVADGAMAGIAAHRSLMFGIV